jgi:Xaa-Pro aminopeptidase
MKAAEFRRRRRQLMRRMGKDAIAVIPSARQQTRNRDNHYPFRQDSDFHYLTGFPEPNAVAVLAPNEDKPFILFCQPGNPDKARWEGALQGLEGAKNHFGADLALPIEELDQQLPKLIAKATTLHYTFGSHPGLDTDLPRWLGEMRLRNRRGDQAPRHISALDHLLHEMRLIKSSAEIDQMRQSAKIAAAAHQRLMVQCRPGMWEYQLEAEFSHACAQQGARELAYPTIVGGGANACVLHYQENAAELQDGDLVLVDAGCELGSYAADITRTFPVNGRFSKPQRALYELVLAAQLAAIEQVRPGASWNAPHEAAVKTLTKGLVKLGLLKGPASRQLKQGGFERYYMHRTGHWLGLDVHDVGYYKKGDEWRCLEPGMVLTIEPGLYINPDDKKVEKKWRGIGIRIEDDVLVTKDGHEILSQDAPKLPQDIEALMTP